MANLVRRDHGPVAYSKEAPAAWGSKARVPVDGNTGRGPGRDVEVVVGSDWAFVCTAWAKQWPNHDRQLVEKDGVWSEAAPDTGS